MCVRVCVFRYNVYLLILPRGMMTDVRRAGGPIDGGGGARAALAGGPSDVLAAVVVVLMRFAPVRIPPLPLLTAVAVVATGAPSNFTFLANDTGVVAVDADAVADDNDAGAADDTGFRRLARCRLPLRFSESRRVLMLSPRLLLAGAPPHSFSYSSRLMMTGDSDRLKSSS